MSRHEREVLVILRRRNGRLLRWLAFLLIFVFAAMAATNYFTAADKHGPENFRNFLLATGGQSLAFLLLFLFSLTFPNLYRKNASLLMALVCPGLLTAQAFMLHWSAAHPVTVTLVEYIGFGVLLQMPFRRALVFFFAIYLIPLAFVATGATPFSNFIVVTIGGPVIASMACYLQNMIVAQGLTISRKNRDLSRSQRSTAQALQAVQALKRRQDLILDTVTEGLFLIDSESRIDSQFSAALPVILDIDDPGGRKLVDLIRTGTGAETAAETARFLRLHFRPQVAPGALQDLNPLMNVAYTGAAGALRWLDFRFSRIEREGQIIGLLGAVQDVSEQRKLETEIAARESAEQERMQLVFRLVQIESELIAPFLEEARETLERVAGLLESPAAAAESDRNERNEAIFRLVHSLKGNAAVLDLAVFEKPAHEFEAAIESGADPSELGRHLERLRTAMATVDDFIAKLAGFRATFEHQGRSPGDLLLRTLDSLCTRLARDLDRPVELISAGFERERIDARGGRLLRDILVQLVRNALLHGIEPAEERAAAGKPSTGRIELRHDPADPGAILLRDDGRGLQLDRIRARALETGRIAPADSLSPDQIAALIFEPGLSTAGSVSLHAGRGVGAELARHLAEEAGGSITVRFGAGEFCEFRIVLPENH